VYRLCIGSFEPKLAIKVICDVRNESAKTIPALRGNMRRAGSTSSNSCPPIIQRRGSLPPT